MILSRMEYLEKLSKDIVKRLRKKWTNVPLQTIEDVVQDGFVRYLEKIGNLDNINPQWMMLVCTRILVDKHRHERLIVPVADLEESIIPGNETLIDISTDSQRAEVKATAGALAYPDQK